MKELSKYWRPC